MKKLAGYTTFIIVTLQVIAGILIAQTVGKSEDEQIYATNIWILLNATQWVFAFSVIAMLTTGLFRQLTIVLVLLWIGKLIDEVYYDPTAIAWNDIVNFAIGENIALVMVTLHFAKKHIYANKSRA